MKVATSVWSGEEKKSSTLVAILLVEREKKIATSNCDLLRFGNNF